MSNFEDTREYFDWMSSIQSLEDYLTEECAPGEGQRFMTPDEYRIAIISELRSVLQKVDELDNS